MMQAVSAYRRGDVWMVGALGFFAGLPLAMSAGTLSAWLTTEGVPVEQIGVYALVGLPYALKFLWAPLVDRFSLPGFSRRRGWLVASQLAVAASIALLSIVRPASAPLALGLGALLVAFSAATLDIVVDAYRADRLPPEARAAGAATYVSGYRLGMLASGAGALVLADHWPWPAVYRAIALVLAFGAGVAVLAREPDSHAQPPASLREAVLAPLRELFARPGAARTIAFVVLFKLGDTMVLNLVNPFLSARGYSLSEIGAIGNGVGVAAAVVGAFAGGLLVDRLGVRRALIVFGALQALANTGYLALIWLPPDRVALAIAISIDQLCTGLATCAFVPFLMSLCDPRTSAAQYALLTSISGAGGRLLAAAAGVLIAQVGWAAFFIFTIVIALPALWLARKL
jgi:PAT family beta-lactamase induction signal transducer AmpG